MTSPAPETPAAPDVPPPSEASADERISALDAKVDAILGKLGSLLPGGNGGGTESSPEPATEPPSIAAEVRAELKKLKAEEDRKARADADLDARVDAKVKEHVRERKPKEYRKITSMIWGRDEDEK